ncbi:MAG: aminopeptidase P family protein [Anaerolineales bacterium]
MDVALTMDDPRVPADAAVKRERLRAWMERRGFDGVVLSRRDQFAWVTSGGDNHVLKNSELGFGNIVVTREKHYLVAHTMDAARIFEEQVPNQGYELVSLRWFEGDPALAARRLAGEKVAADTALPEVVELNRELSMLHYPLTDLEIQRCRWLGRQVDEVLTLVASELHTGQSEEQIAQWLACEYLKRQIELDVLIVGSDQRIFRYRHPLPTPKKIERYVLLHPAARRWGLHANVSRSVHIGKPPEEVLRAYRAAATIEARILAGLSAGISFAQILEWQKTWYAELGFADEWQNHFQGGPTGYVVVDALRNQTDTCVEENQAFDWFITITGAKVEELALLTRQGVEIASHVSTWPGVSIETSQGTLVVPDLMVL